MPINYFQGVEPLIKGVDGSLTTNFDTLGWKDDDQRLDPFKTEFDAEVERYTAPYVDPRAQRTMKGLGITLPSLPKATTRGEAVADRIAVSKGVDVGSTDKAGAGKLIDVAKTMIGVPYVFGSAAFETSSFDCSDFTQWAYKRGWNVSLPRTAAQQWDATERIGRDELQPGDLIFYDYGRLGGAADHVAIYMGNGRQIAASSGADKVAVQTVDWDNFKGGGRIEGAPVSQDGQGSPRRETSRSRETTRSAPVRNNTALAPLALSQGAPAFSAVIDSLFAPDQRPIVTEKTTKRFRGGHAAIEKQLYQGFIDAGRPDLARLVGTKDFTAWINAESGFRPDATSPANNNGLANDGLFQVWRGHAYNSNGEVASMTPYEQAKLIVKYFDLSAQDVHTYAEQIRAGEYKGWG